ncbi:MAG: aldo/keto reductase [Acidobacteriota bacterium]
MRRARISKRRYKDEVKLSILGLGGMVLVDLDRKSADSVVAEAFERGVNYFDVAPFYGNGEAEKSMGIALAPYRNRVFLACKTLERSASGALSELDESLRRLRTDERFPLEYIQFPVNIVCCARGHFGPQVLEKAINLGVARLAIKAMAHGPWRKNEKRIYPNCWYRPIDDRDLARQALRYTLSQNVTAAIPPGDIRLFRMALDMADDLPPLNTQEYGELTATASNLRPLLST